MMDGWTEFWLSERLSGELWLVDWAPLKLSLWFSRLAEARFCQRWLFQFPRAPPVARCAWFPLQTHLGRQKLKRRSRIRQGVSNVHRNAWELQGPVLSLCLQCSVGKFTQDSTCVCVTPSPPRGIVLGILEQDQTLPGSSKA